MKKVIKVFQSIYRKVLDKCSDKIGFAISSSLGLMSFSIMNVSADIVGKANNTSNSWIETGQNLAFPVGILMLAIGIGWSLIGNKKIGLGIILCSVISYFCLSNIQDLAQVLLPK